MKLLFTYTEMLLDVLKETVKPYIFKNESPSVNTFMKQQYNAFDDQIDNFLSLANHEILDVGIKDLIIVEKNVKASQAAQILSSNNIKESLKILEYNHFSNEGNLERKKEILISLASKLEPERNDLHNSLGEFYKKGNNGKVGIVNNMFEMFNTLHLRHNNSSQYEIRDDKLLEHWYDNIYNTILMVVISTDQTRILREFEELKRLELKDTN